MRLTRETAKNVARNIIEDGYKGDLGVYDNNRIWFKVQGVDYSNSGLEESKFVPKLRNIGSHTFDVHNYGDGRKLGIGKLSSALYLLFNNVEEPLDCTDTEKLHKTIIEALNNRHRAR